MLIATSANRILAGSIGLGLVLVGLAALALLNHRPALRRTRLWVAPTVLLVGGAILVLATIHSYR